MNDEYLVKSILQFQVDNESFQCLTCNMICALSALEAHFSEDNHKNKYKKCGEGQFEPSIIEQRNDEKALKKIEEATGHIMKPNFDQDHDKTKIQQNSSEVLLGLPVQSNPTLAASSAGIPEASSSRKKINDLAEFANEHNLTYNEGNANAFCRLCNVRLPAFLKSMHEHVNGMNHKNKAKENTISIPKNTAISKIRTIPMSKFVKRICAFRSLFIDYVILNDELFLTSVSYSMVTLMDMQRCQICNENVYSSDGHMYCTNHIIALEHMPVVRDMDGEFIRKVSIMT